MKYTTNSTKEQSDLGPYCLQYGLPMGGADYNVMIDGLTVNGPFKDILFT